MFNLSGSEIIVILLLALVVLGPEKLPEAMRRAGKTFAELKKLSSGFQDEVRKGFDEPSREVKKTAAAVKSAARFPTIAGPSSDKPTYNPETDPVPEPPEGSSVAEPLDDASAVGGEADAADVTAEPTEVIEPAEVIEPVEAADNDATVETAEVIDPSEPDPEPAPVAEADHTA